MEFDIDKDKVVGVVHHERGSNNARIKVLAYLNEDGTPFNFTSDDSKNIFEPEGFIFEPGFFKNREDIKLGDFISFYVKENDMARYDLEKDQYRIDNTIDVRNYGINAREIDGFKINNSVVDLPSIIIKKEIPEGNFYAVTDEYIIGKLNTRKDNVIPEKYNRIKCWLRNENNILKYDGHVRLHNSPIEDYKILDCRDDKQLFEWFREYLNQIQPEYVDFLDKNTKWRKDIPSLFADKSKDKFEADKIRFKRIDEKFNLLELSFNDVRQLIEKSESLHDVFKKAIETHKDEFKKEYDNELVKYAEKKEEEKARLKNEIKDLHNRKYEKENLIEKLDKDLKNLELNKNRIIDDFSIIKEVLGIFGKSENTVSNQLDSFIMESVVRANSVSLFSTRDEFVKELQFQLNRYGLIPNYADRLLNVASIYKAMFVKDIKMGIAIVEATGNAKYIIQQVEPDWLHFKDFWSNGLGAIWESAHKSPDTLHFLLLQDINLSSPECYARPLLDMMNGVRKHIPYSGTVYPNNLKIIATKISIAEPEIGLPLIAETFKGWGAVGISGEIYRERDGEYISSPGYLNTKTFEDYKTKIHDKGDIKLIVGNNFMNLFEIE